MRHALPWEQKRGGGDQMGHTQEKSLSRPHSLSPSTQDWGGGEKRERESNGEKENPHTHTLAHTSVPVKPEWRDNKEAGR